ncbi:hypothetical protein KAU19_00260 [Candidatus Parcubacteria bacterium]|nr:hypothetical protein [Candidatus Parcubacteria bacterium]
MTNKKTVSKKRPKKEEDKFSDGFVKFMKALEGHSRDVSIILRCHLLAEYFLDQVILTLIPRGDLILTEGHFTFTNKLLIVKSLDAIDDEVLTSVKHLNTVRNNCSHQMDYSISEADIDLIGRPFGRHYTKLKKENKKFEDLLEDTLMSTMAQFEGCLYSLIDKKQKK